MRFVYSLILVGLLQEIIVALGLPLNVATIILVCIFSMLFSDFRARSFISLPTPPIMALTEFFHADAETNVYPLLISWYLIYSLWRCWYHPPFSTQWTSPSAIYSIAFWPSTWPKMPFKVMHRKEVTHSNGSYERKSRGRKLANKMGQANIPMVHS